jgi:DtxR family Mn-dependent transcriptional regulator
VATSGRENLSSSLEDYLEAILHVTSRSDVARSRDIAEALGVTKASVTGALKTLSGKQLVNYEPYGFVTLTKRGRAIAEKVAMKHDVIESFFTEILGVEADAAQEAACKVEHSLGADIMERLSVFMDFVKEDKKGGHGVAWRFGAYLEQKTKLQSGGITKKISRPHVPLSSIKAGQKVTLANIKANDSLRSRLAAMGMVPNTQIIVVSNASPGPFVVNVKGSKIALGRGMAEHVMVEQAGKQE